MFIDSGRIIGDFRKGTITMRTGEKLKLGKARDEWEKCIAQGWRKTKPVRDDS